MSNYTAEVEKHSATATQKYSENDKSVTAEVSNGFVKITNEKGEQLDIHVFDWDAVGDNSDEAAVEKITDK